MIKAVLMFLILFAVSAGLIFGYRAIKKNDVVVSGKLIVAAIISFAFTLVIFLIETQ